MNSLKEYSISFVGLKLGMHKFDFQISDKFFEFFEYSRVQKGDIALKLPLTRSENMLQLDFHFQGSVNVICDHCGENFDFPLDFNEKLLVKFTDQQQEDTEEVVFLQSAAHQIDLAQIIYEYVNLALPMRLTHPENEEGEPSCDLAGLENSKSSEETNETETDPRWEALKKLR
jgi:uncharacterized metal-binding protein YceD (DUF177 family)